MNKSTIDRSVTCDLCGGQFLLNKENLQESKIVLKKSGEKHEVVLTQLRCPCCGKSYPVVMDDAATLLLLSALRAATAQRLKYIHKKGVAPEKLVQKCTKLSRKLDFKRHELAEKFNGAIYQFDGQSIQLDYRYHTR